MEKDNHDVEVHQQKILEKIFDFTAQLAELQAINKSFLELSKEREVNFNKKIEDLNRNLKETITNSVAPMSDRISEISNSVKKHDEILEKVTDIQSNQAHQLENIQKTLDEVKNTKEELRELEIKIKDLENRARTDTEMRREKLRARWNLIGVITTGIFSITAVLLSILL